MISHLSSSNVGFSLHLLNLVGEYISQLQVPHFGNRCVEIHYGYKQQSFSERLLSQIPCVLYLLPKQLFFEQCMQASHFCSLTSSGFIKYVPQTTLFIKVTPSCLNSYPSHVSRNTIGTTRNVMEVGTSALPLIRLLVCTVPAAKPSHQGEAHSTRVYPIQQSVLYQHSDSAETPRLLR